MSHRPPSLPRAPSASQTLRRLYLTLFMRGRTSRGLRRDKAPKSLASKLGMILCVYGLIGLLALSLRQSSVFVLSTYLHAMTLVFLGMFVTASAGEILFNKEESDILLHRPISTRVLLWSKIAVLIEVALWLAGAFNLVGLFVGTGVSDGSWRFPWAHAFSTVLEALFCASTVVIMYQACLRWFGRERLEGMMTTAQVLTSVALVAGSQLAPHLLRHADQLQTLDTHMWWLALLPPAWFAGIDDALAGRGAPGSWALGGVAVAATGTSLWLAFAKLVKDYGKGLQTMSETAPRKPTRTARRRTTRWVDTPPISWCLRDSVSRAAFILITAYLTRDRDVKLRLFPGLVPMLVVPFALLLREFSKKDDPVSGVFGLAFAGGYLSLIPLLALDLLRYSQHWQAADMFRAAPLPGPARICQGARQAVLWCMALPSFLIVAVVMALAGMSVTMLALLLPGLLAMPVFALIPSLKGQAVPLSMPTEEAKSVRRGFSMFGLIMVSLMISMLASWAWTSGWFWRLIVVETLVVGVIYLLLRQRSTRTRWPQWE